MSVKSCIKQSLAFIEASGFMSAAIENQSHMIIAAVEQNRGGTSLSDATQALKLMKSELALKVFTNQTRNAIIEKIVNFGSEPSEARIDGCEQKLVTITVQQQNLHFENYLTEDDWNEIDRFHKGLIKADHIMRRLATRSGAIRLWNPKESVGARIAAIVAAEMDPMPAGHLLYDWARSYKEWLVRIRKRNRSGVIAGPSVYPEDAESFAALHPGTYDDNQPPIESKIEHSKLQDALACAVMRKSNKRSSPLQSQHRAIEKSVVPAGHQDIASQSIKMLFDFMQRRQTSDTLQLDLCTPSKRPKTDGRLLAIENGSPTASLTPPTIGKGSGEIEDGGIEDEPTDIDGKEEELNIDKLIARTSVVIDNARKSREQSNAKKRPAAHSKKRPAGSKSIVECTTCPSMPSVTESIGTLMWKGCKIQSNPNKRKWRVFPKPNTHLYDKGFPWGADPNAAWKSVLAYCNNPVLPKGTKPFK